MLGHAALICYEHKAVTIHKCILRKETKISERKCVHLIWSVSYLPQNEYRIYETKKGGKLFNTCQGGKIIPIETMINILFNISKSVHSVIQFTTTKLNTVFI